MQKVVLIAQAKQTRVSLKQVSMLKDQMLEIYFEILLSCFFVSLRLLYKKAKNLSRSPLNKLVKITYPTNSPIKQKSLNSPLKKITDSKTFKLKNVIENAKSTKNETTLLLRSFSPNSQSKDNAIPKHTNEQNS